MSQPNYNPKIGTEVSFNPANPPVGDVVSKIALMEDYYTLGGFRVCDSVSGGTISEVPPMAYDDVTGKPNYRNYITTSRRKLGRVVYTMDDGKFWQLINNPTNGSFPPQDEDTTFTSNSDWIEIIIPGSLSSVTFKDGLLSINYIKKYISGEYYIYDEWGYGYEEER